MSNLKYILCAIYIFFSVSGLTLIKMGSNMTGEGIVLPFINISLSICTIFGIMCYGISFCLYLGVVSSFDLGFIIPIVGGVVNICILLVSFFLLKEKLTVNMIVGAVIVIVGIVIMNLHFDSV